MGAPRNTFKTHVESISIAALVVVAVPARAPPPQRVEGAGAQRFPAVESRKQRVDRLSMRRGDVSDRNISGPGGVCGRGCEVVKFGSEEHPGVCVHRFPRLLESETDVSGLVGVSLEAAEVGKD